MTDLTVIGNISLDTIEILDQITHTLGGGALNIAIAASLTGCSVKLIGTVGSDFPLESLPKLPNLDLSNVTVESGNSTNFHLKYFGSKELEFIKSEFGSPFKLSEDFLRQYVTTKILHITCKEPFKPEELVDFFRYSLFSTDVSWTSLNRQVTSLDRLLSLATYLFLNEKEYEQLNMLKFKIDYPHLTVIITRGVQGLIVIQNGKNIYEIPAFQSKVIDPTGAGDVLVGGCLGMLCKNQGLLFSLCYGSALASICVEDWGTLHLLGKLSDEVTRRTKWIIARSIHDE